MKNPTLQYSTPSSKKLNHHNDKFNKRRKNHEA